MLQRSKLLLTGLAAIIVLAAGISTASAGRFSVNEQRIRITWQSLEFEAGIFGTIRCPITMEGSFHSATIRKTIGALIGAISRATAFRAACRGSGKARVAQESLPWLITYEGFTGALPNITRIRTLLQRPKFILDELAVIGECTARAENPAAEIETGAREAGGAFKPDNVIPDESIEIPCGGISGVFKGTGRATKLNSTEKVLLRLI